MLQPCVALIEVCSNYSVFEVGRFCTSVSIGPVNCHNMTILWLSVCSQVSLPLRSYMWATGLNDVFQHVIMIINLKAVHGFHLFLYLEP